MNTFCFEDEVTLSLMSDWIATVPRGIRSREALFACLASGLQLPSYFGENWDALSECLRDLEWISERRIVLIHQDVPLSSSRDQAIYLDVLREAAASWKPSEPHELVVLFSINCRRDMPSPYLDY